MSQWDPNDPNNPYNQQQWGQKQGGQGQQGHGHQEQGHGHQQQGHQQQGHGHQQPHQQPHQQQQQWGQQPQQGQQQWGQQPQQDQQQWGQQPQQDQQQSWQQQGQQQWGGQAPAMQGAGHGAGAYQDAYNETFGNADGSAVGAVATLGVSDRIAFLRKTYLHLFGAVALFVVLEVMFLWTKSPLFEVVTVPLAKLIFSGGSMIWLAFLGGFMVVGYIADKWAQSDTSQTKQYLGLGLAVLAWSVMFIPLLLMANYYQAKFNPGFSIIGVSGIVTIAVFAGLTLTVFVTKKDFSFMRGILTVGMMAAIGLIIASAVIGFNLGVVFSAAMLFLAGGYILYYTSRVMLYYRPGQHVAAALALFASLALLFWYVIQIVMHIASASSD